MCAVKLTGATAMSCRRAATSGTTAGAIWREINPADLRENILSTPGRADVILRKGDDHRIEGSRCVARDRPWGQAAT